MPTFKVRAVKKSGQSRVRLIVDDDEPLFLDVQKAKKLAAALYAAAQVADPDDGFDGPGGVTI